MSPATSQRLPSPNTLPVSVPAGSSSSEKAHYQPDMSDLCDPRLGSVNFSRWTSVPIEDGLAARCISLYLVTDHPLLGHFDPDLFISGLISERGEYCSSLLVNALLYWASVRSYIVSLPIAAPTLTRNCSKCTVPLATRRISWPFASVLKRKGCGKLNKKTALTQC